MSGKRTADKELNADNWDVADDPEEVGKFRVANEEDLQKRVIRTARRRANPMSSDEPRKGIFSSFGGFNKSPTNVTSSPFSFLSNVNGKSEVATSAKLNFFPSVPTTTEKKEEKKENDTKPGDSGNIFMKNNIAPNNSDEYCSNLKSLNLGVCEWIKSHIDKNPYCILTPIFDDYKKYLKEFDKYKTEPTEIKKAESIEPLKESQPNNDIKQSTIKPDDNIFGKANSIAGGSLFAMATSKPLLDNNVSTSTPKSDEKPEAKKFVSPPSNNLFNQGFSSTPVSKAAPMFSFGQKLSTETPTSNFSFGTMKPFSFGSAIKEDAKTVSKPDEENDEDDEPPKVTFTPVEEEGSIYSKRCKVFVKKDKTYGDRGVGTLYLKPISNTEKYQLIVRADTSLGNLLINIVLSESIPIQRMGKNNVMIVCIPTSDAAPPPVPTLLRVKTAEEADTLLETLNKYKK